MVNGKHLSVAAPRSGQDHTELRLENEPDTPMHHSYRGLSSGAWRYRVVRWVRFLMIFMLIVVTATWLFVDLDDLHIRGRGKGRRSERVMNELPSGFTKRKAAQEAEEFAALRNSAALLDDVDYLAKQEGRAESADFGLGKRQDAVLEEGELGWGVADVDYAEDDIVSQGARERWLSVLEPLSVQPLTIEGLPVVDKSIPVVLLLPNCCEIEPLTDASVDACHKHVEASCEATGPAACFTTALSAGPCGASQAGSPDPNLSFYAGLQRLGPFLRQENWTNFQVLQAPPDGADTPQSVEQALQQAKIILVDAAHLPGMLDSYKQAAYVALDGSPSATLPPSLTDLLASDRVKAVWRAQVLTPSGPQNGPLLNGSSHMALLQMQYPAWEGEKPVKPLQRDSPLSESSLQSIKAMLNHAYRFRYPLDCGGDVEHLRFLGAFSQNESHWKPPRLQKRSVDVAYIARNISGKVHPPAGAGSAAVARHTQRLKSSIASIASEKEVLVSEGEFGSYSTYLQQLMDVKVLVVPSQEAAETTELDFEATLCGCLLVKVEPGLYTSHPYVFRPVKNVYGVPASWQGLQENLHMALEDLEHSQRMADRATHLLLEHSDMTRYAGLVDTELIAIARSLG